MKDFTDLVNRVKQAQASGGWDQVTLKPQDFLDLVADRDNFKDTAEYWEDTVEYWEAWCDNYENFTT